MTPILKRGRRCASRVLLLDFLVEQLGVGNDDFLARERSDARAFQADFLHRSAEIVERDRVTALERLVENDRQRREQVGKYSLRGQPDGDAAHTQPGNQPGDVDADIVEHHDRGYREQDDRDHQVDERHRVGERFRAVLPAITGAAFDQPQDQLADPDRDLIGGSNDEQEIDDAAHARRGVGKSRYQPDRQHKHEEMPGFANRTQHD